MIPVNHSLYLPNRNKWKTSKGAKANQPVYSETLKQCGAAEDEEAENGQVSLIASSSAFLVSITTV